MTKKIILASSSASRKAMLEAAGLNFEIQPANVDEAALRDHLVADGAEISQIAGALAEYKAQTVSRANKGAMVIGADQLLVMGHEIFEKPANLRDARTTLQRLRGQTHELICAVAIFQDGKLYWRGGDTASLTMRNFSDSFLEDYLEREGEALLTSVGAYRLEGYGVNLFSAVDGDHFTILGLPLRALLAVLREAQVIPS